MARSKFSVCAGYYYYYCCCYHKSCLNYLRGNSSGRRFLPPSSQYLLSTMLGTPYTEKREKDTQKRKKMCALKRHKQGVIYVYVYRGWSHCPVSQGNVMEQVTSELVCEEDRQEFSRTKNFIWQQIRHLLFDM